MMYEQYLQLSNIPCGAVLQRIMNKEGISQSQLAERSGIVRQRIYSSILVYMPQI